MVSILPLTATCPGFRCKGATVKTGQQMGKAGKDDDGSGGQVDFILMIETKMDPSTVVAQITD